MGQSGALPIGRKKRPVLTTSCSRKVGEILRLRPGRAGKSTRRIDRAARLFLAGTPIRSRALARFSNGNPTAQFAGRLAARHLTSSHSSCRETEPRAFRSHVLRVRRHSPSERCDSDGWMIHNRMQADFPRFSSRVICRCHSPQTCRNQSGRALRSCQSSRRQGADASSSQRSKPPETAVRGRRGKDPERQKQCHDH